MGLTNSLTASSLPAKRILNFDQIAMALRFSGRVIWFVCVLSIFSFGLAGETDIGLGSCFNQEKSAPS